MCKLSQWLRGKTTSGEVPSPRANIEKSDVWYDRPQVVIEDVLPPVWLTTVQPSNSMEPLIDEGHIVILSANPKYLDDLKEGDIIVFDRAGRQIIHSIINIGRDTKGWYCYTQGLNLTKPDPDVVRLPDVKWVALGVIWCKR